MQWGGNAWERRSHTFFMFCFKMSSKLFENGCFFGCIPTPILLALHQLGPNMLTLSEKQYLNFLGVMAFLLSLATPVRRLP